MLIDAGPPSSLYLWFAASRLSEQNNDINTNKYLNYKVCCWKKPSYIKTIIFISFFYCDFYCVQNELPSTPPPPLHLYYVQNRWPYHPKNIHNLWDVVQYPWPPYLNKLTSHKHSNKATIDYSPQSLCVHFTEICIVLKLCTNQA